MDQQNKLRARPMGIKPVEQGRRLAARFFNQRGACLDQKESHWDPQGAQEWSVSCSIALVLEKKVAIWFESIEVRIP
jgi:hypothetical protein